MKAIQILIRIVIGGTLALAAIGKLLDNRQFAEILAQWQLFPHWSLLPLGVVTSLSELLLAAWLFAGWRLRYAALAAVAFHAVYVVATVISLLRGIRLADCGCFGILFPHPLNWTMAVEDFIFVLMSLALFFIAQRRA